MKLTHSPLTFTLWGLLLAGVFLNTACRNTEAEIRNSKAIMDTVVVAGSFSNNPIIPLDSNLVDSFLTTHPDFKEFKTDMDSFYRGNDFKYVWFDKQGLIESSGILISRIYNMAEEGVDSIVPYRDEFLKMTDARAELSRAAQTAVSPELEMMLTAQYFNYAKKIWVGDLNDQAGQLKWYLPRKKVSFAELLEKNLASGNVIPESEVIPQYHALRKALAVYREIDRKGAMPEIPSVKKAGLMPGDQSDVIALIKKRLYVFGDSKTADTTSVYQPEFADAVNNFKLRHGLKDDSIITNAMIREMNVPVKKRIETIMVNMERFRWVPVDTLADEFILVNVPQFRLHYYENNRIVWNTNVVVGKPMNQTVIFSGLMSYIVFSPYWNVPQSIINKEILPAMKRNPNYLQAHNMDWNNGRVRQKPGRNNSLGLVKFMFPNANNIYLHDTPSKPLFKEDARAFSHGCIRVADPRDLAIRILRHNAGWDSTRIVKAMNLGTESSVTLRKKIPVHIGYFTCFEDSQGRLNFRDDVYGKDDKLYAMLTVK